MKRDNAFRHAENMDGESCGCFFKQTDNVRNLIRPSFLPWLVRRECEPVAKARFTGVESISTRCFRVTVEAPASVVPLFSTSVSSVYVRHGRARRPIVKRPHGGLYPIGGPSISCKHASLTWHLPGLIQYRRYTLNLDSYFKLNFARWCPFLTK